MRIAGRVAGIAGDRQRPGRYRLAKGSAMCEFQLVADVAITSQIGESTANNHGGKAGRLHWQQLQATAGQATAVRYGCVLDPWHKNVKVVLTPDGPDQATLTVAGSNIADTWQWQAAAGKFAAATLHGKRNGGFDVTVDTKAQAPAP